jgi:hypothetical protein
LDFERKENSGSFRKEPVRSITIRFFKFTALTAFASSQITKKPDKSLTRSQAENNPRVSVHKKRARKN